MSTLELNLISFYYSSDGYVNNRNTPPPHSSGRGWFFLTTASLSPLKRRATSKRAEQKGPSIESSCLSTSPAGLQKLIRILHLV